MPSRALLLVNPRARRGAEGAEEIAVGLRRAGLDLLVDPSGNPSTWPNLIRRHARTEQIVVGNGRYYGAALAVAPDAAIDDARLDVFRDEHVRLENSRNQCRGRAHIKHVSATATDLC